ncbi:MAG: D-alanine--D-alanine ligase, partial [Thermoleophilia bacterium]|nr:D-alanine--D-alanine ligase [Thermoleophilia bacterium]
MRVAVLCGGRSHERAVSLRTGARVEQALLALGHEPVMVDTEAGVDEQLRDGNFDVAFIALHGRGEEDGAIQALLDLLQIPYTGSRSVPCTAAYDKARAKRLLVAAGVPTPTFVTLSEGAIEEQGAEGALAEARETIGFPLVVKPARSGSSLGTRFVEDAGALPRALMGAMSYDLHVVV